jgi:hypothetical protein
MAFWGTNSGTTNVYVPARIMHQDAVYTHIVNVFPVNFEVVDRLVAGTGQLADDAFGITRKRLDLFANY